MPSRWNQAAFVGSNIPPSWEIAYRLRKSARASRRHYRKGVTPHPSQGIAPPLPRGASPSTNDNEFRQVKQHHKEDRAKSIKKASSSTSQEKFAKQIIQQTIEDFIPNIYAKRFESRINRNTKYGLGTMANKTRKIKQQSQMQKIIISLIVESR